MKFNFSLPSGSRVQGTAVSDSFFIPLKQSNPSKNPIDSNDAQCSHHNLMHIGHSIAKHFFLQQQNKHIKKEQHTHGDTRQCRWSIQSKAYNISSCSSLYKIISFTPFSISIVIILIHQLPCLIYMGLAFSVLIFHLLYYKL